VSFARWAVVSLVFLCVPLSAQSPTQTPIPPGPPLHADVNGDGIVDLEDLVVFKQEWHKGIRLQDDVVAIGLPNLPDGVRPLRLRRIHASGKSFQMGSPDTERGRNPDEGPVHTVSFDYDYYIGETEVTQAQWVALMGDNPALQTGIAYGIGDDLPIFYVSWDDCQDFLRALSALGHGTFRLPTEAEWEFACRAGSTTRFYYGDSLGCDDECTNCRAFDIIIIGKGEDKPVNDASAPNQMEPKDFSILNYRKDFMWFCASEQSYTHRAVGLLFPNGFGLYDMLGNVNEWCQDAVHDSYVGAPSDGSAWEASGKPKRIFRGGSSDDYAYECRSADRKGSRTDLNEADRHIGFRIARTY
jgi:formylglycine-generating enzyme required for sulfatase activity